MARNTLSIKSRVSTAAKKVRGVKGANKGTAKVNLGKVGKVSVTGPRSNKSTSVMGIPNFKQPKGM